MRCIFLFCLAAFTGLTSLAQTQSSPVFRLFADRTEPAFVDMDSYVKLTAEVQQHRAKRLIPLDSFLEMSKKPGVVILDARSDSMYAAKHVKGAIHLNFADFTAATLARLIPDPTTTILIYCNNNFTNDRAYFPTKAVVPVPPRQILTLALNVPTYINLYGYGYRNVYELSQAVSVNHSRLEFEGTAVHKKEEVAVLK